MCSWSMPGISIPGQAISNRADAKPDILAYNYMGYDAVTVGNHEFDKPLNVLLKQMQWAEFPFVTSNIQRNGTPLGSRISDQRK